MGEYVEPVAVMDNATVQPDLSRHLSIEARSRLSNPMKDVIKMIADRNDPNMISLANGDPHHTLYPFRRLDFEVPSLDGDDPASAWRNGTCATLSFTSHVTEPCTLSIKDAFQYSGGAGLSAALKAVKELTDLFHSPPGEYATTLTMGNADGVTKAFRLLGDKGDYFLTDEMSFPGMTNAPLAHGVKWIPVKMDNGGMIPEDIERILEDWDEDKRGRRPHVLYAVPTGQNPTGAMLSIERRRSIYKLAQRWDFIIIEDDPYCFLQYDRPTLEDDSAGKTFSKRFASSLVPSFLSMDVDGRVMRIDSFSKVLAPGMRLGWITSNTLFHNKLVSYTDSAMQHPHAFGQIFISEMLGPRGWGIDGFCKWLRSLCTDYQRRRDWLLQVFEREVASQKLASADVPRSGMFLWVRVHIEGHPRYRVDNQDIGKYVEKTNVRALMEELFEVLFDNGLAVMPGYMFAIPDDAEAMDTSVNTVPIQDRASFLRLTFCGTEEIMENGVIILGNVLRQFFELNQGVPFCESQERG